MSKDKKICPILTIGEPKLEDCIKDKCAWWDRGECVLVRLARTLQTIVNDQIDVRVTEIPL